jgi:uncharacterized protein YjbI with pentapeptide repeats
MSAIPPNPLPPSPSVPPGAPPVIPPAVPAGPDPDAALKTEKLGLEIKQLKRTMSLENVVLERFKTGGASVAAIVAFFTFLWTVNAGIKQLDQARNGQDQDRFDKALTRLGSGSVRERLTGAAGLGLFLTSDQSSRHAATLRFLASALVIEDDPNVRQAILDTFSHMDAAVVPENARRDGLQTLVGLNRSARKASLQQEGAVHAVRKDPKAIPQSAGEAIRASALAIVIFIRKGTAERNFSGIDCTDCDLSSGSSPLELSEADFSGAVLANARFWGTKLTGSSFAGADLTHSDFEGADLQHSDFTSTPDDSYTLRNFMRTGRRPELPIFACADATDADFSGSLLFGVIESSDPTERIAGFPDLFKTNIRGTKLSLAGVYALSLRNSKSPAPFDKTKINTYRTSAATGLYKTMQIAESADWQFVPSSPSLKRSWQYLLSNLQSATNTDQAYLPIPMADYQKAPAPAQDSSSSGRCDKYSHAQGH